MTTMRTTTQTDIGRIPSPIRELSWKQMRSNIEWYDGQELLVAVPVNSCTGWRYELSLVICHCDDEDCWVTCEDEVWGWELSDVEWFVTIR